MTNPTPEQIARKFHEAYERLAPEHGYRTRVESAVHWDDVPPSNKSLMIAVACEVLTALVAAAGVTPQVPGAAKASYISPSLPGMIRNLWKSNPSENSVRTALKLAGDLIQELIDIRAAPVQVDEAKLDQVVSTLSGPFDGSEGLDSFTLAWALGKVEAMRGGGQ